MVYHSVLFFVYLPIVFLQLFRFFNLFPQVYSIMIKKREPLLYEMTKYQALLVQMSDDVWNESITMKTHVDALGNCLTYFKFNIWGKTCLPP